MWKSLSGRRLRFFLAAAAVAATSSTVAFGVIPGPDGVIRACYQKENGMLRVVSDPSECRPSEIPLSWSAVPPAEGWTAETVRKTDGAFSTASTAFVPVPGTEIAFDSGEGPAELSVSGTELGGPICPAAQVGVRLDGVDYPLEANHAHTFAADVGIFRLGLGGVTFVNPLSAGDHTAVVILRNLPDVFCTPATVDATEEFPLNFVIEHRPAPAP